MLCYNYIDIKYHYGQKLQNTGLVCTMSIFTYPKLHNIEPGEDIDVCVKDRSPNNFHPPQGQPHMHDFILLSYVQSGECTQLVDGVEYRTKRGDMLFVGMNQTHQILLDQHVIYINILLSSKFWDEELTCVENFHSICALSIFNEFRNLSEDISPVISFSGADIPDIEQILAHMLTEFSKRDIGFRAILKCCTQIIITKMLRAFSNANKYCALAVGDAMEKILGYIDINLGRRLTLYELAQQCSYNPSYFSRIFKECFGMPFSDYLQKRRIHTAMELMRSEGLSVEAVMERVGYSDKKSFYRYFRKITSQTPAEFRRNIANQ